MDSSNFSNEFSEDGFWKSIKKYAKKIGGESLHKAFCLWLVVKEENVPAKAKAIAVGALGYLISPLDAIPDITPVIGFSDDILVIAGAFVVLASYITKEISTRADAMLPDWIRD